MTTTEEANDPMGGGGVTRYHVGFALAFGLGAAILPPAGAETVAGWLGGAVGSLVTAGALAGVTVLAVRQVDDWRPGHVPSDAPDSRLGYAVFGTIALQLFVFGTALAAGPKFTTLVIVVGLFNIPVAGAVAGDAARLRGRGVDWRLGAFGYAATTVLTGSLGGLYYWYRRGRQRAGAVA